MKSSTLSRRMASGGAPWNQPLQAECCTGQPSALLEAARAPKDPLLMKGMKGM